MERDALRGYLLSTSIQERRMSCEVSFELVSGASTQCREMSSADQTAGEGKHKWSYTEGVLAVALLFTTVILINQAAIDLCVIWNQS